MYLLRRSKPWLKTSDLPFWIELALQQIKYKYPFTYTPNLTSIAGG